MEKVLKEERDGVRPLFLPKGCMEEECKMAKLRKIKSWRNAGADASLLAGAPLTLCPMAGSSIAKQIKQVCNKFEKVLKIKVRFMNVEGGDCKHSCAVYRVDGLECETENLKAV